MLLAALVSFAANSSCIAAEIPSIPVQIVDAFSTIFGAHPGYRVVHAKGVVCEGLFTPSPAARSISRAAHLQEEPSPVIVRFSDFAGTPAVASGDVSAASPRGMSIKFVLPDDLDTDIVAHSYDGFPAATPEDFLGFLKAIAATGTGSTAPTPLDRFAAQHPAARRFLEAPKPIPTSYATEAFFGVDAFRFTDAEGVSRYGRYRILPVGGTDYLEAGEAARRAPNFLASEMAARLASKPAEFRLVLQIAADEDPVEDATIAWPEERTEVELGIISLRRVESDSDLRQRRLVFTPLNLVDGIASSGDPLLAARAEAYVESLKRRSRLEQRVSLPN